MFLIRCRTADLSVMHRQIFHPEAVPLQRRTILLEIRAARQALIKLAPRLVVKQRRVLVLTCPYLAEKLGRAGFASFHISRGVLAKSDKTLGHLGDLAAYDNAVVDKSSIGKPYRQVAQIA